MIAVTQWFGATEKPVRVGVYEISETDVCPAGYAYWDGHGWGVSMLTPKWAIRERGGLAVQGKVWRGLAMNPL
jgi:hypothetical protein